MMAALRVFRQVGEVADSDFLAMEVLPLLWVFSLGPLLNLPQFQAFMSLIKNLSGKIEREHTRKLQEMRGSSANSATDARATRTHATVASSNGLSNGDEADFESLVSGRKPSANGNSGNDLMNDWGTAAPAARAQPPQNQPTFSWQSAPASSTATLRPLQQQAQTVSRAITPDTTLSSFASLTPASPWSQPLQPTCVARQTSTPTARPMAASSPLQSDYVDHEKRGSKTSGLGSLCVTWKDLGRELDSGPVSCDANARKGYCDS
jgi:SCY1-like protein 2